MFLFLLVFLSSGVFLESQEVKSLIFIYKSSILLLLSFFILYLFYLVSLTTVVLLSNFKKNKILCPDCLERELLFQTSSPQVTQ